MRNARKRLVGAALVCVASLVSALLFCIGCSVHEMNRYGQSQDVVTFSLAGGTYLSLAVFVVSAALFVAYLRRSE